MVELGVAWKCRKCNKYQNRLLRFRNDEIINDKKVVQRKRKAVFICIYCRQRYKLIDLIEQKTVDTEIAKQVAYLNKITKEKELGIFMEND